MPSSSLFLVLFLFVCSLSALVQTSVEASDEMCRPLLPLQEALKSFPRERYQDYQKSAGRLTTEMLSEINAFLVPYADAMSRAKRPLPPIRPPDVSSRKTCAQRKYSNHQFYIYYYSFIGSPMALIGFEEER